MASSSRLAADRGGLNICPRHTRISRVRFGFGDVCCRRSNSDDQFDLKMKALGERWVWDRRAANHQCVCRLSKKEWRIALRVAARLLHMVRVIAARSENTAHRKQAETSRNGEGGRNRRIEHAGHSGNSPMDDLRAAIVSGRESRFAVHCLLLRAVLCSQARRGKLVAPYAACSASCQSGPPSLPLRRRGRGRRE